MIRHGLLLLEVNMFEKEIKEMAKQMAKWTLPAAASVSYNIVKFPLEASINSDKDTVAQMLKANKEMTSQNLQGNAGNKALEAIENISTDDYFSKGVESVK